MTDYPNYDYENWPELSLVERPGRYLGGEREAVPNQKPDARGRLFRLALAFPDVYEIAHGHLGHKILYQMINSRPGLSAERVYAPWPDWEAVLRRRGARLASLESRRPLADFDLLGFSLQYELGYSQILAMLELGGLPLKAAERGPEAPLVAGGGPCAYNPEPLADFFDFFFLGDAEASFLEDLEIIKDWRAAGPPKAELFARLAGRPGLYIPSLFEPHYGPDGRFQAIEARRPGYDGVSRAVAPHLAGAPFPLCQITPLIKPVHDRVVVEIGRGCSRGCRFCQAGYVYRPVRERPSGEVLNLARANLTAGGQDEASFLSLSAGDHSQILPLVSGFMDEYAGRGVALSLPSLRVRSLGGELARQIRRARKTGFTLAPEAGSQRLRDIINKDLSDDDLMAAAEAAFSLGWRTLKLYFMVGLPGETDEDLAGIAGLTRRLGKLGGRVKLNLGVAHFTPKAHTPFQWHPASRPEEISRRLFRVRELVKAPGLTPKWNAPGASWVESALARGDRRLGPVLELVHLAGARFEAWGDRFDPRLWSEALEARGLNGEILLEPFRPGDAKPYGHLFAGVGEDFLLRELEKSRLGLLSRDCRVDGCHDCGACRDGAGLDLAAAGGPTEAVPARAEIRSEQEERPKNDLPSATFMINFIKGGRAAFLGHLELVELFKRAFRRAGLELALSEGFHPQPRLSFLTALPLGVVSEDEYLKAKLKSPVSDEDLARRLNEALPPDLSVRRASALISGPGPNKIRVRAVRWLLTAKAPLFSPGPPLYPGAVLEYTDKKGAFRQYLLSDFVEEARALDKRRVEVLIRLAESGTPKPRAAAGALWRLSAPEAESLELRKTESVLA
ncbi:MAG: TIGR03960 family B12-binding radical SAM protein [Candidatus Adiutrix sp.]|nr:TIGR03960 family B12-binding radical SAM protein [Candidatus Adiutrix sp.]